MENTTAVMMDDSKPLPRDEKPYKTVPTADKNSDDSDDTSSGEPKCAYSECTVDATQLFRTMRSVGYKFVRVGHLIAEYPDNA